MKFYVDWRAATLKKFDFSVSIYVCKGGFVFHFQQILWKKKYDFSKANRIIREVTKSSQREKTNTFSAQESGLPCNKSDSRSIDDDKKVNLTETSHKVTDSSSVCSHQDIKGVSDAESRVEDTNSDLQHAERYSSSVKDDNPHEFVAESTERNHSLSGTLTDEGEIRIRPEERKHVSLFVFQNFLPRS